MEDLYCADNGRLSIDPIVIFKMVLIQHLYGLPSLRRNQNERSIQMFFVVFDECADTTFFNNHL